MLTETATNSSPVSVADASATVTNSSVQAWGSYATDISRHYLSRRACNHWLRVLLSAAYPQPMVAQPSLRRQ